jgi:hypothetical protein
MNAGKVRRRAPASASAAILLLSAARLAGDAWIVPGAASTKGLNETTFVSSLILVNPGAQDRTVSLALIPGLGAPRPPDRTYTVVAGTTLTLQNVLYAAWSLEGTGALRVTADGPIAVFARVSNLPNVVSIRDLSFSSALPVIPEGSLLEPGSVGHSAWIAQSADTGGGQRTNVAVAFPDEGGGAAAVGLFDGKGSALATFNLEASQPAFLQKSIGSLLPLASAAARISVTALRGRACAYTATVDNVTGDVTVFPAEIAPSGPTAAIGNGVVLAAGVGGKVWETEVHFFNPGTRDVTGNAIFLGQPEATIDLFSVPAGATIAIRDVVGSRFHVPPPVAGAVLWNADGPLVIQTRTSAPSSGLWVGGTAGGGQRAVPLSAFQTANEPPRDLGDLPTGEPFARTNLLLVGGLSGCELTIEAADVAGRSLGMARRSLAPLGFAELPLSSLLTIPQPDRFRIRVRVDSGDVDAQAAVVDGITNDPIFYEAFAQPSRAEPGSPLPAGIWGRVDGLEGLKADATTITVERWCRKGAFPQARLDAEGKFAVGGLYTISLGPTAAFSAVLRGQVKDDTVTIAVFTADDDRPIDSAGIFHFGRPYSVPTDPCPIEYARTESSGRRTAPRPLAPRPSNGPGLLGTWGGDHLNLTIGMSGGVLEYDCAHGTIDVPFATDAGGRFNLAGTHTAESPGPVRDDKPPVAQPALYSGSTDGATMTLTVTVPETGQVLGPYTLTRGVAARILKCL